ncbi:2-oxoglutarate dehydrogenase E1 component [Pseudoduganella sp. RAF19]|uniref:2-oxoglutarate dehydrogenase E1 component n=1 Tax=Pseudoduganella sp. RAF19 TaxID=3233052 RepID=UPI003F96DE8C
MLKKMRKTSFLFGENVPYIEELYEAYLEDAASVSKEWHDYFAALQTAPAADNSNVDALTLARRQVAVQYLIAAYRMVGSRQADLDPLRWSPVAPVAELNPGLYGIGQADMNATVSTEGTYLSDAEFLPLKEMVAALNETYCGTLGAEFMYLADAGQRQWWQMRLESSRSKPSLTADHRRHILQRLIAAEGLEKYLHNRYVGQKRFSLEGGDSLIVLLDELIRHGAANGIKSVILGMAHRGRLNVLVNTVGKPPQSLFDEFDGKTARLLPAGDVKYHKGFSGVSQTEHGNVDVTLAFNPSHLEIVNPVVQGMARAHAEQMGVLVEGGVLPVEIHGDAAMSGQGIVMETMNLSYTKGHGTSGTIHIVVNNQIGFTTSDPAETRSSFYCTDIAKLIEAPVLHVNADDPEAVVEAVQLAIEYRMAFKRSVVIDLVCFRRHGHQEQDTPHITQPMMYRSIASHPGAAAIYAQKLVAEQVVTSEDVTQFANEYREYLARANVPVSHSEPNAEKSRAIPAELAIDDIRSIAQRLTYVPKTTTLHPLVAKVIASRREMAEGVRPLDWGMGEHMAFATLLAQGVNVRLSGQDSERGTFSHRHAVLNDQRREDRRDGKYTPLYHVAPNQGAFTVNNSILSEAAVLAFEYGYSSVRSDSLVIWEAQFGDFANGGQVVIDNFISAAAAKWGQQNGLTLFLPHGQEGAGPEHASARLERYLQLCAQENIQVCQPTTPAQLYHLLRRQASLVDRKPLIVMTPKSLLRHAEAVSTLEDLAHGQFREVLGDAQPAADIRKVIISSGKVYFDLLEHRRTQQSAGVALIRLEQLYPFPAAALKAELARYSNVEEIVWAQEEPRNQGAWKAIEEDLRAVTPATATLRDSCREASASTAPGYMSLHLEQQARVVHNAFEGSKS